MLQIGGKVGTVREDVRRTRERERERERERRKRVDKDEGMGSDLKEKEVQSLFEVSPRSPATILYKYEYVVYSRGGGRVIQCLYN